MYETVCTTMKPFAKENAKKEGFIKLKNTKTQEPRYGRKRGKRGKRGKREGKKAARGYKKDGNRGSRRRTRSTPSAHPGYWLTLPIDWARGIYAGPRRKPDPAFVSVDGNARFHATVTFPTSCSGRC